LITFSAIAGIEIIAAAAAMAAINGNLRIFMNVSF
jgi:hypothetical protein